MTEMKDKLYWIWLSLIFPYGSNKPYRIITEFGPPEDFFRLSMEGMGRLGFFTLHDLESAKAKKIEDAQKIVDECGRLGIEIVTFEDERYPQRLREIYAPPMVLYTLGDISGLDEEPVIAMVGTRRETEYSNSVTGWLAKGLAEAGAVVVSGCAVGLDAAAHVGAIQGGGRTIGVLGCGLDVDYPYQNRKLKLKILEKGALISELPPGTEPNRGVFPVRNRILAGLSLGVVVTHAPERSGSLITADHALDNGRDVFCVPPYSIFDPGFFGVVKYLRQGATPVFSPEDILAPYLTQFPDKLKPKRITGDYVPSLSAEKGKPAPRVRSVSKISDSKEKKAPADNAEKTVLFRQKWEEQNSDFFSSFDENQLLVYNNLESEPKFVDELAALTKLPVGVLFSVLTEFEIAGLVRSYSGQRYGLSG